MPPESYRMNNSPTGWWKEGRESAKRWGGVTLVPAGCRSPGHCFGNHSRQPDGVSVGEREKDGSGSVLPGPARPRNNWGPIEKASGDFAGAQVMRMCVQTRQKHINTLVLLAEMLCSSSFSYKYSEGKKGFARTSSRPKDLIFAFEKFGSMPPLHFHHLCCS